MWKKFLKPGTAAMKTLGAGSANYGQMKARTTAITSGEHRPARGRVSPGRRQGTADDDRPGKTELARRTGKDVGVNQIEPLLTSRRSQHASRSRDGVWNDERTTGIAKPLTAGCTIMVPGITLP